MVLLFALLLQQSPVQESTASIDLGEGTREGIAVSRGGAYVVVGESDRLKIFDAATLALRKELLLRWTAFGFSEQDDRLLVVGDGVTRFLTRDWSLDLQLPLDRAAFAEAGGIVVDARRKPGLLPGQAHVLPDLDFYFRTKFDTLALGSVVDRKLIDQTIKLSTDDPVRRVLSQFQEGLLVAVGKEGRDVPAITVRGRVFPLVGSVSPFFIGQQQNTAICISPTETTVYRPGTWQIVAIERAQSNRCAVLDAGSGWILVGDDQGMRGWGTKGFPETVRLKAFTEPVLQMAIDPARRALFAAEKRTLRRWKLAD